MTALIVLNGPTKGQTFQLEGDTVFVGRASNNNIQIENPSISRRHLRIRNKDGKFLVKDLQSQNGTRIGGRLLRPSEELEIEEGVPIVIGDTCICLGEKYPRNDAVCSYSIDLLDENCDPERKLLNTDTRITDRRNLELVYEVSSALMQSLDINEICEKVMDYLFRCFRGIDSGAILLIDHKKTKLKEVVTRFRNNDENLKIKYSRTTVSRVIREGKALVVSDTSLENLENLSESIVATPIKSIMCVPLISKSKVRGAIYVHSSSAPRGFQESDLILFTTLSGPAAVAIENARLYSERQQSEEALRLSEEKFSKIFHSSPEAILISSLADQRNIDVNESFLRTTGYTREEMVGNTLVDLNIWADPEDSAKFTNLVREQGEVSDLEAGFCRKSGESGVALVSAEVIDIGGDECLLTTLRDITEKKEAEKELEKHRYHLEDLVKERTAQIVSANEKLKREIEQRKQAETQLAKAKDAAEFYAKKLEMSLGVSESLRKEMEEAKGEAETANRAKSEFLASITHEIRAPMTTVIGMADLLEETPVTSFQRRFIGAIRSSGETLLQIINDILDLSKVEAGQIELENIAFDLLEVVRDTCEAQAFRAQEKGLELVWWVRPEVETRLFGDPIRLGQVLSNLIGNGVKFTEKGEVFVEVRLKEPLPKTDAEGTTSGPKSDIVRSAELEFGVTDTGVGIPVEKRETIFQRFTQADTSTTRKYGGTGLGLAISRRLVELMAGRIWVESTVGEGSTFYFTAKFNVQQVEQSSQIPEADINGVKVLIVDDNATNRRVLSEMFSGWGASATEEQDGEQGLVALRRARDEGNPYNLVLLDSRMPGVDGFDLAKQIQEDATLSIPVILMLTSGDRKFGLERSKELGIANYLLKPIRWSDMKEAVMAALGRQEATDQEQVQISKPSCQQDLRPHRILLVEDNEKNRMLVQEFLKQTPYLLDMAEDGGAGLDTFKSSEYDLVLMDIEMPVMDGHTATTKIREWEADNRAQKTPIVALSAHAIVEHSRKSLEAGCTAHLTKPIKKVDLLAAIERYVKEDHQGHDGRE
ncbi:MAG: response regulator [Deltaproteobacteria bacterium]|nr:MAG: response regulator [Deltaproteobacteria bacterium]